jgi:hypothetical protein
MPYPTKELEIEVLWTSGCLDITSPILKDPFENSCAANPATQGENVYGIGTSEPDIEFGAVVSLNNPLVPGNQFRLFRAPRFFWRLFPSGKPVIFVKVINGQLKGRSQFSGKC